MVDVLLNTLAAAGTVCTAVGALVLYRTLALRKKAPMDKSNRLNHLRLVWFALNAPHRFAELYTQDGELAFPWLRRDEGDNV